MSTPPEGDGAADVAVDQPVSREAFEPLMSVPLPAVMTHPSTDLFSLAICGYLGGRFVMLRTASALTTWSLSWWLAGVAAAFVTTFGGGTLYAVLMQRPGVRSFGWMDPLNLSAALLGYGASCVLPSACQAGARLQELIMAECGSALRVFDCANNSILIAWGASKSSLDTSDAGPFAQACWTVLATYLYSFGGGITRDVLAIAGGVVEGVGNFAPEIVLPALVGTLLYHIILRIHCPPLVQLGLGMPVVFYMFHQAPALLLLLA